MRFFNTSGPVVAADHYCLAPLQRLDLNEILTLLATKRYFVLHAPRQTGKTTVLLALRDLRRVVEPLLSGGQANPETRPDDLQYVRDLGLVAQDDPIRVANPIYREVIPRFRP